MRHLKNARQSRRPELTFVVDPETGRRFPVPAGGAPDDDDDDDDEDDDESDDDDDDDDDDDSDDDDDLGEAGKKALSRERQARRDAQRESRAEKRRADAEKRRADKAEDRLSKIASGESDVDIDDVRTQVRDEIEADVRREVANERAALQAERVALSVGVKPKRLEKFVKLLDLDEAIEDDGTIDRKALKEIVKDELDAVPEFRATSSDDRDDDGYHGADQGPRRRHTKSFDAEVDAEAKRLANRHGVALPT